MNLCSKCYGELMMAKDNNSEVSAISASAPLRVSSYGSEKTCLKSPSPLCISSSVTSTSEIALQLAAPASDADRVFLEVSQCILHQSASRGRHTNKCLTCKKRLGLYGFKCRCGNNFCALHRYSEKHSCTFDYKAAGKEAIARANPIVKALKVEKI
ncbi:hypothetical protein KP509_01G038300 [Ceratopteris richardii]|nr:hypothetical protein KP509_01G038300 [Ceratopteris richardii]